MKHNVSHLLAAGSLLTTAAALIQVQVRYSDSMIDVGNLDLFAATWERIYAADGNAQSVLTDVTNATYNGGCNGPSDDATLNAKVTITGQWGAIEGLGLHDSREALVTSIWSALQGVSDENQHDVYNNCYGTTWQESLPDWAYNGQSACGGANPTVTQDCPCDIGSSACQDHSLGHKVPSLIKANLYDGDGALLADSLEITFESAAIGGGGACNSITKVGAALLGLVPGPGALFSAGVMISCYNLG